MKKQFLILVIVVLLSLVLNLFQNQVKNFFYSVSQRIQISLSRLSKGVFGFLEIFLRAGDLQKQNKALKLENQDLKSQIIVLKHLEEENQFLTQALELDLNEEFELLLADVVMRNASEDFIIINKGAKDGVQENMTVITAQKVLVGRINQVYSGFSEVFLVTNKEMGFPVKIEDKDCLAKTRGRGNLVISLDLVPRDKEISSGDWAVTSGLESNLPQGLLVGEVKDIQKSDLTAYQEASLRPGFEIEGLERVFVVKDY